MWRENGWLHHNIPLHSHGPNEVSHVRATLLPFFCCHTCSRIHVDFTTLKTKIILDTLCCGPTRWSTPSQPLTGEPRHGNAPRHAHQAPAAPAKYPRMLSTPKLADPRAVSTLQCSSPGKQFCIRLRPTWTLTGEPPGAKPGQNR